MGLRRAPHVFSRFAVPVMCMGTGALSAAALLVGAKPTPAPQHAAASGRGKPPSTAKHGGKPVGGATQTGVLALTGPWQRAYRLAAGATVEIAVHLERPSALPANGRIAVEWTREGVSTQPTSNWRKVLHALDSDVCLIYRAPAAGAYTLRLKPVTDEEWAGASPRWRERGNAPALAALPPSTPWPAGTLAPVRISVRPIVVGGQAEQERLRTVIACEPNDTPEQAQPITLTGGDDVRTWEVTGGADEVEFFDNGRVGQSGEDWFRLDYTGATPHLLTAQLSLPNQMVAARLRFYRAATPAGGNAPQRLAPSGKPDGGLSALTEMTEGQDENERSHQQDEPHRASICRLLQPGESYYLRVEANAPGYQLQLRTLKPAPYDDPRMAIRQGIYTQIGQVDAWLTNRPRGASVERRLRDSGNLLGTQCMSCHTQSGVWGPAVPFTLGYRPENVQNYLHLVNVMYECLRPTNQMKDAANNTSLAPLDLGDGPAGTRAAGFNVVNSERWLKARRLHSMQQVRTANFVLNTSDPGGINAAGPGSNIGFVVVNLMATEILKAAWERTGDPKYFRKMEEKARQVLAVDPQFTDDVALRLDYYGRVFPIAQYAEWRRRAGRQEAAANLKATPEPDADKFVAQVRAQMAQDEARLRAIQNADGSWGFSPGATSDGGKTWRPGDNGSDPSPTALGITGLTAIGCGKDDPAIARGVKALLAMQKPPGRWNKAAQTGFVSTAYALHALARLYPVTPPALRRQDFLPQPQESLLATVKRVQALALTCEPKFADLLLPAAAHESPLVRYWAMIGLGATHTQAGVPALARGLGDPVKMVREAAVWGMRQTLLDDRGWNEVFAAGERGDDTAREAAMQALGMRADAVLSEAHLDWTRLTSLLDRGMNRDPHPGVRAWAAKTAWQWWVWNPPVRRALNAAWLTLLERPESNALVENSNRYSSQALFIVNGHKANGSGEHQYQELAELFGALAKRLEGMDTPARSRLATRLVGIGATFYTMSGGDGGPGQMGYVTAHSGEMMGRAALLYLTDAVKTGDLMRIRIGLEGGANVPHQPLTAFLVDYSLKGPEAVRQLAAGAISDPRSVSLAAVPELVEPQLAQILRGAQEPPRRAQVSDPIIDLWAKVNWTIPKTEEQQRAFFDLIIPRLERYVSPEQVATMADPAQRAVTERDMNAAWYLADRLGEVLQQNPDLHQEIVFRRYFPAEPRNPLEAHYWLRSVEWLLAFNTGVMPAQTAGAKPISLPQTPTTPANPQPDPALIVKDHALQLYLDALKPTADPRTRAVAIRMANRTAFRTNPEVLRALAEVVKVEKDTDLRNIIANVLKQSDEKYLPDLIAALKAEKHPSVQFDARGEPALTATQREDIVYFRDYVIPEMTRQKRTDQQSCMGCHGLPGRVPSMYLRAPDKFGYLPVTDLLVDYRTLQKRVNLSDLERSKFLRKPLNIQDGKEDGHQGGRRYTPTDEGYLLLKKWVEHQPEVQKPAGSAVTLLHP